MTAQATFGLTLLTAIFVALLPHIVGFGAFTRLPASDLIVGITVAVLAMCFGSALDRAHGITWTLPVFGLWIFFSPWIFVASPTAGMIWTHVICGLLITVFGLSAAQKSQTTDREPGRYGTGLYCMMALWWCCEADRLSRCGVLAVVAAGG